MHICDVPDPAPFAKTIEALDREISKLRASLKDDYAHAQIRLLEGRRTILINRSIISTSNLMKEKF